MNGFVKKKGHYNNINKFFKVFKLHFILKE